MVYAVLSHNFEVKLAAYSALSENAFKKPQYAMVWSKIKRNAMQKEETVNILIICIPHEILCLLHT